jgi:hypothetical protein
VNRKQRDSNRHNAARLVKEPVCRNCGERGKHFVPPSFGESGFYACAAFKSDGGAATAKPLEGS